MAFDGLDRQLARALQRLFGLLPMRIGTALCAERADIENREQVETIQLGRAVEPRRRAQLEKSVAR
jgi:hypothetical protein